MECNQVVSDYDTLSPSGVVIVSAKELKREEQNKKKLRSKRMDAFRARNASGETSGQQTPDHTTRRAWNTDVRTEFKSDDFACGFGLPAVPPAGAGSDTDLDEVTEWPASPLEQRMNCVTEVFEGHDLDRDMLEHMASCSVLMVLVCRMRCCPSTELGVRISVYGHVFGSMVLRGDVLYKLEGFRLQHDVGPRPDDWMNNVNREADREVIAWVELCLDTYDRDGFREAEAALIADLGLEEKFRTICHGVDVRDLLEELLWVWVRLDQVGRNVVGLKMMLHCFLVMDHGERRRLAALCGDGPAVYAAAA